MKQSRRRLQHVKNQQGRILCELSKLGLKRWRDKQGTATEADGRVAEVDD